MIIKKGKVNMYKTTKKPSKNKIYTAIEIARYIINYANDHTLIVSNLKLQKILYFIQLEFLTEKNAPCFNDNIEAWGFGPVVPTVYKEFKKYGDLNIPKIVHYYDDSDGVWNVKLIKYRPQINKEDRCIIDDVINECNKYSTTQLVDITCKQTPWVKAYGKRDKIIDIHLLNDFINTLLHKNQ